MCTANSREVYEYVDLGLYKNSVLSAQFCGEPKTTLKSKVLSFKNVDHVSEKDNKKTRTSFVKSSMEVCH